MEWTVEKLIRPSWDTLETAENVAAENARSGVATLLFSEPQPTFTAGPSAEAEERLWTDATCESQGISIRRANRGGRWTYHGPGQLVVYPIAPLKALGLHSKATRPFMDRFQKAVCGWLSHLEVETRLRDDRPFGIYSGDQKLAAFGVRLEAGVSRGGMALYLSDQNAPFQGLIPCGISGETMTCLAELGRKIPWTEAVDSLLPFLKEGLKPLH